MSEKARKRNVVVMVEELKGVAGSGLRGGRGMEGYGGTGVMEGTSQQGKQKKKWLCGSAIFSCGCACWKESFGLSHVTPGGHRRRPGFEVRAFAGWGGGERGVMGSARQRWLS